MLPDRVSNPGPLIDWINNQACRLYNEQLSF